MLAILFRPFGLLVLKRFKLFGFLNFRHWWKLFQKRIVCTKLDFYVFINLASGEIEIYNCCCQLIYQRFSHCCWVHAPAVGLLVPCIVVSASALTLFIRFIFEMYSSEIIKQRSLSGIGFWLSCLGRLNCLF